MQFDAKKIVVGGLAAGLAILVVSQIVSILTQQLFQYDILALGGMRPANDPIMALFFVHPWVFGFAMAIAFQKFKGAFKSTGWCRGKAFGVYTWLLAGLPSAFLVYSSMDYPIGFTAGNVVGSFLYMAAAGLVLEKLTA